jgi:DNA (cytosine-5)-methyltransferase 1
MSLSFPADFLVRIFQAREKAQELAVRGADFGKSTRVSFARYDRDSFSWRIPHCLFPGDWGLYSQTWPRWGIMVHGECFQLPPWALGIGEIVSGDYSGGGGHEVMSWPTPMKHDMRGVSRGQRARDELQCAVEIGRTKSRATYPTPTVCGNNNDITGYGMGLATFIKVIEGVECRQMFPTPRALSLCGGTGAFEKIQANENLTEGEKKALSSTGGRLNPDWVEWLMGWPVGWTDIELDNGAPFPWLGLSDDPADAAEPSIRRITTRQQHRAHRIETLGNGQVPLCAAVAFNFAFEILRMALGTFKRKDQE